MLNKTVDIVKEAGQIIKDGFGINLLVEFQTNRANLVTNIDKVEEKVIIFYKKGISNSFIYCGSKLRKQKFYRIYLGYSSLGCNYEFCS